MHQMIQRCEQIIWLTVRFSVVVNQSVVVAIDPEYEIFNRIKQVDQAIVNALGYFKNSKTGSLTTENDDVTFWCSNRWVHLFINQKWMW